MLDIQVKHLPNMEDILTYCIYEEFSMERPAASRDEFFPWLLDTHGCTLTDTHFKLSEEFLIFKHHATYANFLMKWYD
jgi:hypothetical protein